MCQGFRAVSSNVRVTDVTCQRSAPLPWRVLCLPASVQLCRNRSWLDCQTPWGEDDLHSSSLCLSCSPDPYLLTTWLSAFAQSMEDVHERFAITKKVFGCECNGHSLRQMPNMRPMDILWDFAALAEMFSLFLDTPSSFSTKAFRFLCAEWPPP